MWQHVRAFKCAGDERDGALPALRASTVLGALLVGATQLECLLARLRLSNEELRATKLAIDTRQLDREKLLDAFDGSYEYMCFCFCYSSHT